MQTSTPQSNTLYLWTQLKTNKPTLSEEATLFLEKNTKLVSDLLLDAKNWCLDLWSRVKEAVFSYWDDIVEKERNTLHTSPVSLSDKAVIWVVIAKAITMAIIPKILEIIT